MLRQRYDAPAHASLDRDSYQGRTGLPVDRLRAALRLVLRPDDADRLVSTTDLEHAPAAIRDIVRAASSQMFWARITSLYRRRDDPNTDAPPLAPTRHLPLTAALNLALHTGLDIDAGTLASATDESIERVGRDLYLARRALDSTIPAACEKRATLVGRCRDRSLDPDERIELMTHLRVCDACRTACERSEALDVELRAEVGMLERELSPLRIERRRTARLTGVVVKFAAVAVVLALLAGGVYVLDLATSESPEPIPLITSPAQDIELTGWLVQGGNRGRIEARNLATGEIRNLRDAESISWGMPTLSPDNRRMAVWVQQNQGNASVMEFWDVGGGMTQRIERESDRYLYPSGWLRNDTFLIALGPAFRSDETSDDWTLRAMSESQLIAINVESGEQRVLIQGNVGNVYPSPDGTLMAVVPIYDQNWAGQNLELRPFDGEALGEPIASLEHRFTGFGIVWLPDSSGFYYSRVATDNVERSSNTSSPYEGEMPLALSFMSRDGESHDVSGIEHQPLTMPVSISPDGSDLIASSSIHIDGPRFQTTIYRIPVDASSPVEVLFQGSDFAGGFQLPIWSPDGRDLLLSIYHEHYLPAYGNGPTFSETPFYNEVLLRGNGSSHILTSGLGYRDQQTIAWLPADALPPSGNSKPLEIAGNPTAPEPVAGMEDYALDGVSSIAPNGMHLILRDTSLGTPYFWDFEAEAGRRVQDGISEFAWLPDGNAVIGADVSDERRSVRRRLTYMFTQQSNMVAGESERRYDPVGIGEQKDRLYRHPTVSPDGSVTTFFVTTPATGLVELYAVGVDLPIERVAEWTLPENHRLEPPLISLWVDDHTLLVAKPTDWDDGFPQEVELIRITVSGGQAAAESLTTLGPRGRDRGILLYDATLSPDGTQLAWRIRHFTERTVNDGRTDTIHTVPVTDISRPLEIASADPGFGMTWSPDSRWLVAALDNRLALISSNGREFEYITDDEGSASYPIWIGGNEVWFSMQTEEQPSVWHLFIR